MDRFDVQHLSSAVQRSAARRPGTHPSAEGRIHLSSVDRWVDPSRVVNDPSIGVLVSEDLCWRIEVEAWMATRPARWRLLRLRKWIQAGEPLADKRRRLVELACDCGITAHG